MEAVINDAKYQWKRNKAHAYISKEPEVAAIRNMIWAEKETLLDVLSEINGQMKK